MYSFSLFRVLSCGFLLPVVRFPLNTCVVKSAFSLLLFFSCVLLQLSVTSTHTRLRCAFAGKSLGAKIEKGSDPKIKLGLQLFCQVICDHHNEWGTLYKNRDWTVNTVIIFEYLWSNFDNDSCFTSHYIFQTSNRTFKKHSVKNSDHHLHS